MELNYIHKRILILGAGVYQVPLIRKAKEMGYETIVCSIKGNYPGLSVADKVFFVDTTNTDEILKVAIEEKIDAICTTGTDVAIVTIGFVSERLGLNGLSYQAAQIASNKMLMKTVFEEHGVRTARFRKISLANPDLDNQLKDLRLPLIFKATDTSGSRGIIRVNSPEDFENALKVSSEATKLDYIIVEEFLEGIEFGAQALVYKGELKFVLPHGDYVFQGDTGVPVGHYAPYEISETLLQDAFEQTQKAIYAMGLDNCAINADFILCDNSVYVLEIGARGGATCLCELVSIYYGIDYYEKILDVATGVDPSFDFPVNPVPNASKLLFSDHTGKISEIETPPIDDEYIVEIAIDYGIGDTIRQFKVGPDRIGHVITKGETVEKAERLLYKTIEQIHIHTE